jgi:YHS domain-containing protein
MKTQLWLPAFLLVASLGVAQTKMYMAKDGLALQGYDPVAYFQKGEPVKGGPAFTAEWSGATFRFASDENRKMFQAAPEKYAPQYGGHCAYAAGKGYLAKGDATAWKIVDGKLYINYNQDVQKLWEADQAKFIESGDKNWPGLASKK